MLYGFYYFTSCPRMLGYIWQYVYASFLRYWLKWAVRQVTGKCELQRICAGFQPGATRTSKAEYSLQFSKNKVLRGSLQTSRDNLEQCVDHIVQAKNVKPQKDPLFRKSLHTCLLQITGYASLYTCVEDLRKGTFSSDNVEHEDMLLRLWKLLMPTVKLESRVTKQWGDIGFQGDDPKTDFRGMGMLGLTNLVFFSEHYTEEARQVLSHANHPTLGYSYAIVGINLTEMAYSLLKSGDLKPHFYNTVTGNPELHHFHHLYCYLAYEFDKFWVASKPQSIMEFNHYREKFHSQVKVLLRQPGVALTLTMSSEH
ncbi:ELMO domain-containing protein 2 [Merluccius polli]|uniref:ELMO domain-containing protein 2 n=1 Tax=Merluccius polli TaxID=89951 RepID=A0AA47P5H8_MERPO|nr:ELMO domain-containing protein 2 [Merluccius polli]